MAKQTAKLFNTDQNTQDQTTNYWFNVSGENFALSFCKSKLQLLDCDGCPVDDCNDHDNVKQLLTAWLHTSSLEGKQVKKLNFRHSLKTMNAALAAHDEKVNHIMENGSSVYIIKLLTDGDWVTCGFYYSATDVAEYINKRNA
jgi:hypothetical protein